MLQKGKRETTDDLLARSFKDLLCKYPMEKITIKDITDKAGVIRPTFYNHFSDKYALLEYIVRHDLLAPIKPLLMNDMIQILHQKLQMANQIKHLLLLHMDIYALVHIPFLDI